MASQLRLICIIACLLAVQVASERERLPWTGLSRASLRVRPGVTSRPPPGGSDCGETRINLKDGDHGVIESPGYPINYRGGLDCEWKVQGEPGTVIQATVFEMRTESSFLSDASDSLFITLNGNWNDSQRFSGDMNAITPLVLVSEQNSFGVRFRTSRFSEGNRGFKMMYTTRGTASGKPAATEPGHDVYTVIACNYIPVDHPMVFPETGISLKEEPEPAAVSNQTNPNPFLVALVLDDQQFCSGTLVSDRHVLTSAHCTRGVKKIGMVFGTDNILLNDEDVQRREVSSASVIEHPHFDPYSGANDLSIIKLENPIEVTRNVNPAAFPTWSFLGTTFGGFRADVTGWGDSTSGTVYTTAARKAITISPNAACTNNRGHNGLSMCSRGIPDSTCQADSGSPIVTKAVCGGPTNQINGGNNGINNQAQKPPRPSKPNSKPSKPGKPNGRPHLKEAEPLYPANVLLGVVSYGSCDKGFSFTRITAYLDFISRHISPIHP